MRMGISAVLFFITPAVYPQTLEIPSLSAETRILHIPYLKYQAGNTTRYVKADLQGSTDYSQFVLLNAARISAPGDISLQNLAGLYTGVLGAYVPGTRREVGAFAPCPEVPFNPGSTELDIKVTGSQISMTFDVFPDLVCRLEGSVDGGRGSGNFQCSDFNIGTWSSTFIMPQVATGSASVNVSYVGKDCSFDTSFTGLRN